MREEELLINRLQAYCTTDAYPFHMPGHKRRTDRTSFPDPFSVDITEIDGFDNLHHPEGILKESMEWAADVYGADRSFYLVNGSSSGILAAMLSSVKRAGRILMSRNCHKSAYNGVYLHQLQPVYLYPQSIEKLGIQGGILPEDVEKRLEEYPDIQAVLLVSPTYDGVVSDIAAIAEIVHKAGLPLIVDEAHGAHFSYSEAFPVSSLKLGADIVIQSIHKTLPGLTQTAILHVKYNRPDGGFYGDEESLKRYLSIVQSSSPSYILMASIENSIFRMSQLKQADGFEDYLDALKNVRDSLGKMKHLRLAEKLSGKAGVFDLDISKIVVSTGESGMTGEELMGILRRKYHLEMEMCGAGYVTAITTVMDSREGLFRLRDAFLEIDSQLGDRKEKTVPSDIQNGYHIANEAVLTITEAEEGKKRAVPLTESLGRVSAEFVYIYPPGIPIIAPGERISRENLTVIQDYIKKKLPVQGLADETLETIQIAEE
jgi:arginine/lysine/ornithine decarboxylase